MPRATAGMALARRLPSPHHPREGGGGVEEITTRLGAEGIEGSIVPRRRWVGGIARVAGEAGFWDVRVVVHPRHKEVVSSAP